MSFRTGIVFVIVLVLFAASLSSHVTPEAFAQTGGSNTPPVLVVPTIASAYPEQQQLELDFGVTDADSGQSHTFALTGTDSDLVDSFDAATGVLVWTPDETEDGTYSFTVTVTDNHTTDPQSDSHIFELVISEVNRQPSLGSPGTSILINETELIVLPGVPATDPDVIDGVPDELTFSITSGAPAGLTLHPTIGVPSWRPTEQQDGTHQIRIQVTDGESPPVTFDYEIRVSEINSPPIGLPIPAQTAMQGVPFDLDVTRFFIDPDVVGGIPDAPEYSLDSPPAWLSIDGTTGVFAGTVTREIIDGAPSNPITVTVVASDRRDVQARQSFSLTLGVNSVPVLVVPTIASSYPEQQQLELDFGVTDADSGQSHTFALTGTDSNLVDSFDAATGVLVWTPDEREDGTYSFTVTVTDDDTEGPQSDSHTFELVISEVNTAPVNGSPLNFIIINELELTVATPVAIIDRDIIDGVPDELTYSFVGEVPTGLLIDPNTSNISWTPTEEQDGTHLITIQVTDGESPPITVVYEMRVFEVNSPPVGIPIPAQTAVQGMPFDLDVTGFFRDSDVVGGIPDAPEYSLGDSPPDWLSIDGTTGVFAGTVTREIIDNAPSNPVTVTVVASDRLDVEARQSFDLTLAPNEQVPSLTGQAFVADDPDDGDTAYGTGDTFLITFDRPTDATAGSTMTDAEFNANFVTTEDLGEVSGIWSDPSTLLLSVLTANGAPVIGTTTVSAAAGATIGDLVNTADGAVIIGTSNVLSGDFGNDNNPPVLVVPIIASSYPELERFELDFGVTDADSGQSHTFALTGTDSDLVDSFDAATGVLVWTPDETEDGTYSFTVTATDDHATAPQSGSHTFELVISEVNTAPVDNIPTNFILINELEPIAARATDVFDRDIIDGVPDELSYSLVGEVPTGLLFDPNTSNIFWTPTERQDGNHQITIQVTDGESPSLTDVYEIRVLEVNSPPVGVPIPAQTAVQGVPFDLDVTGFFSDPDVVGGIPDAPEYSLGNSPPSWLSIDGTTGVFAGTVTQNIIDNAPSNPVTVTVVASDRLDVQARQSFDLTLVPNEQPVLNAIGPQTGVVGTSLTFTATATDADIPPNTLTFSLDDGASGSVPSGAAIDPNTGVFEWTPNASQIAAHTFDVIVSDGVGGSDSETVTVTIAGAGPDNPTTFVPIDPFQLNENSPPMNIDLDDHFTDADTDNLSYSIAVTKDSAVFDDSDVIGVGSDNVLYVRPNFFSHGVYVITVVAQDGSNTAAAGSFDVVISNVNRAITGPEIIGGPTFTLREDTRYTYGVHIEFGISDPDGPVTCEESSGSFWTLFSDCTLILDLDDDSFGGTSQTIVMTFRGTNHVGDPVPGVDIKDITMQFAVREVNDLPVLRPIGPQTAVVGTQLTFTASATDSDVPINTLTFSLDDGATGSVPSGAAIDPTTGVFAWTPQESDIGEHTFDVIVSDGVVTNGVDGTDSETVTVTVVQDTNRGPSLTGQAFVADDPDDGDTAYGTSDTFLITFDRPTDATLGNTMSDAEFNANFVTSEDLGEVFGIWNDPSTLSLIVLTANGAPVIGTTTVSAAPGATIGDLVNTADDAVITGTSNVLSGDFGNDNNAPVLTVPVIASAYPELERFELDFGVTDADSGQSHTFALTGTDSDLVDSFDAATGILAWTPDETEDGTYSFTVTVTDDHATAPRSDSHTFELVISEVNTAPSLTTTGQIIINEFDPFPGGATISVATDPDIINGVPDELTFSTVGNIPAGLSIDPATGAISWTPTEQQDGTHIVTIQLTDGESPVTDDIRISVGEINSPPVGVPIPAQTAVQGVPFDLDVTGFFSDPDVYRGSPDAPEYSLGDSPPGWLSIDGTTGVFAGTVTQNIIDNAPSNPVTVTVVASDRLDVEARQSFDLTLAPNEQIPSLTGQAFVADDPDNEDSVYGLEDVFIVTFDRPTNKIAGDTMTDDEFNANFVTSEDLGEVFGIWNNPSTFTLIVDAANGAPVIGTTTISAAPGTTIRDPTNALAITGTSNPLSGDFGGSNNVPVLVVPTIASAYPEQQRIELDFGVTDEDIGQSHTFELTGTDSELVDSFVAGTGVLVWTPDETEDGTYSFTVTVTDNHTTDPQSDSHTFELVISEQNTQPSLGSPGTSILINETELIVLPGVPAIDPDIIDGVPDELTFSITSGAPAGLTLHPTNGVPSWRPTEQQDGTHQIRIQVTDGESPPVTFDYEIRVSEINSPPIGLPIPAQTAMQGVPFDLDVTRFFVDPDVVGGIPDAPEYSLDSPPSWLSIDGTTGVFAGTVTREIIDGAPSNPITVTVVASDRRDVQARQSFSLTLGVNSVPVLVVPAIASSYPEQQQLELDFGVTDADSGQSHTFALTGTDSELVDSFDAATGVLVWTPDEPEDGTYSFTVTVTDDDTESPQSGSHTFELVISEVNTAPVIGAPSNINFVNELELTVATATVIIEPDIIDGVPDELSYSFVGEVPTGLLIDPNTSNISWTPTEEQDGTHLITIQVTDGESPPITDVYTIRVHEVNSPPVGVPIPAQTAVQGMPFDLDVTGFFSDPDVVGGIPDAPEYSLDSPPSWLSIDGTTGVFAGTVTQNIIDNAPTNPVTVTVVASDRLDVEARQSFSLTLAPNEQVPSLTGQAFVADDPDDGDTAYGAGDTFLITFDRPTDATAGSTMTDAEFNANFVTTEDLGEVSGTWSDPSTLLLSVLTANGAPVIGTTTVSAAAGATIGDLVNTADGAVIIGTSNVLSGDFGNDNNPPVLTVPAIASSYPEQQRLELDFGVTDADSGQSHTFALTGTDSELVDSFDAATGILVWTPDEPEDGTYSFTVTVTDDHATAPQSDSRTFELVISEVNTAPVDGAPLNFILIGEFEPIVRRATSIVEPDIINGVPDVLTYSIVGDVPTGLLFDPNNSNISWRPTEQQDGTHLITIQVTDGESPPITVVYTIRVDEINSPPVGIPIPAQTAVQGVPFDLDVTGFFSDSDVVGGIPDAPEYSLGDSPPAWLSIDGTTGVFAGTVTREIIDDAPSNPVTVTVVASDRRDVEARQSFDLTLVPNEQPVLNAIGPQTGVAGTPLTFTATATDADVPPNTLTFSLDDGATGSVPAGAAIDPTTGVFAWTPQGSQAGEHTFDVIVSDGVGGSDSETVTVTIAGAGPDNPTTFVPIDPFRLNENSPPMNIDLDDHFTDADTDNLSYSIAVTKDSAVFDDSDLIGVGSDNVLYVRPNFFSHGVYVITVVAQDGSNTAAAGSFDVVISNVNRPITGPEIIGGPTFTLLENTIYIYDTHNEFGISDPDGPVTCEESSGSFWTLSSQCELRLNLDDSFGGTSQTIVMTFRGTNHVGNPVPGVDIKDITMQFAVRETIEPPVLRPIGPQTGVVGTPITFTAIADDSDLPPDTLTFSLDDGASGSVPSGAAIDPTTGAFEWTPQGSDIGPHTFDVMVSDGVGGTDFETITVTVDYPPNNAPVLVLPSGVDSTYIEGQLIRLDFGVTDADSDQSHTFALTGFGSDRVDSFDAATGVLVWMTDEPDNDTYNFTVKVTDDHPTDPQSDSRTFYLLIREQNIAPVLDPIGPQTGVAGTPLTFTASATDEDIPPNILTFSLDDGATGSVPAGAAIDPTTGAFAWTPQESDIGPHTFDVVVSDAINNVSETVTVTVYGVNSAPVFDLIPTIAPTYPELQRLELDFGVTDADSGQSHTFALTGTGSELVDSFDATTGILVWTPEEAEDGTYSFTVTATDDHPADPKSASHTFELVILEQNSPPDLDLIGERMGSVGTPITFTATATDEDVPANTLTFSLEDGATGLIPSGAAIDPTTGAFAWTPQQSQIAAHTFDVVVSDGAATDSETVTVTVVAAGANNAPVLVVPTIASSYPEQQRLELDFGVTDADSGQSHTFALTGTDSELVDSFDAATGILVWTPEEAEDGAYSFTVTATDNHPTDPQSASHTFDLVISEQNIVPDLNPIGTRTGNVGTSITFTATATDADIPPNTLRFSLDDGASGSVPTGAAIDPTTGAFAWTPQQSQIAAHTFDVVVSDGAATDSETVTVTVIAAGLNNPPILVVPATESSYPEQQRLELDFGVIDADTAQSHTFALTGTDSNLVDSFDENTGVLVWTPEEAEDGTYSFTVTVTDNHATAPQSDSHTFELLISEVNTAPIPERPLQIYIGSELALASGPIPVTDPDIINGIPDELAFSFISDIPDGLTIDPTSGIVSWIPTEQQDGLHPIVTIQISDGELTTEFNIVFSISEVNSPPVATTIPAQTAKEGVPFDLDASEFFSDPDIVGGIPDAPAYSLDDDSPDWLSIDGTTGVFAGTLTREIIDGAPSDPLTVTVVASDRRDVEARSSFSLTLEANTPPVITVGISRLSTVGGTNNQFVRATDADGDTLTFSLEDGTGQVPEGASIDPTTGRFTWRPMASQVGDHFFNIVVSDGRGGTDSRQAYINVSLVNHPPVLIVPAIAPSYLEQQRLELDFGVTDADADQSHTFALTGTGSELVDSFDAATGVLVWTPDESEDGTYRFTVTVTDSFADILTSSASHTFNLLIEEVNRPPALNLSESASVDELTPLPPASAGLSATDPDIINGAPDELTFSIVGDTPAGLSIDPDTGAISWTPTEQQDGDHSVTVQLTDGESAPLTETIVITVNDVATPPTSTPIPAQTAVQDVPFSLNASQYFSDDDVTGGVPDVLSYTLGGTPPDWLSIDGTSGQLGGTATREIIDGAPSNPVTVTVVASDLAGAEARESFSLTLDANDPPVLDPIGPLTGIAGTPLTFTATATDEDVPPNTLTFSLEDGASGSVPTGAAIDPTTGAFAWTPQESDIGPHTFDVIVSDGVDGSDSETVTVTVTATVADETNSAPVLVVPAIASSYPEQVELRLNFGVTDADSGQSHTFALTGTDSGLVDSFDAATGTLVWTPDEPEDGTHRFTVTVTDDHSTAPQSDSHTFDLVIEEQNRQPIQDSTTEQIFISEMNLITFQPILVSDPDIIDGVPDELTYSLVDDAPDGMIFDPTDGTPSLWTPSEEQDGIHRMTYEVTDGETPPVTYEYTLTIFEGNESPVGTPIPAQTARQDVPFDLDASDFFSDPDIVGGIPDAPEYSLDSPPDWLSIDSDTGMFSGTATREIIGNAPSNPLTVTVVATDRLDVEARQSFSLTLDANDPPVLDPIGPRTGIAGSTITFTATATDEDVPPNTLTFSLEDGASGSVPAGAAIDPTTGDFEWTPQESQIAEHTFDVVVSDGVDGSDSETVTVTVSESNSPPVLDTIGTQRGDEGTLITFTASATDPDVPPNTLEFTMNDGTGSGVPSTATLDPQSGVFEWTPTEREGGTTHTFSVMVSDGIASDSQLVTITVDDTNTAPVLTAPTIAASYPELAELRLAFAHTDSDHPEDGPYQYELTGANSDLVDSFTGGVLVWTPAEDEDGTYRFTVTVTDSYAGNPLSDSHTFDLVIDEVNSPPALDLIGARSGVAGTPLTFTATATDDDIPSNTLTFSLEDGATGSVPAGAAIDPTTGVFAWTPQESQIAEHTFDVVVSDGVDGSDSETVTVTVSENNSPPVLDAIGPQRGDEGTLITFTASATDPDVPPNTLEFTMNNSTGSGVPSTATLDPQSGVFEWTPVERDGGTTHTFPVIVSDGIASDSQLVTVTVDDTNTAPVLTAPTIAASYPELAELRLAFAHTDSDHPEDGPYTYELTGANSDLVDSFTGGVLDWTPAEDEDGTYRFTVTVTDSYAGNPLSDSHTFDLVIDEVNSPPALDLIGARSGVAGTPLTFTATATDDDIPSNTLTFSLEDGASGSVPAGAAIDQTTGAFAWTPQESQTAEHTFDVIVSDGTVTDSQTVTVTVASGINSAPVLVAPAIEPAYPEGQRLELDFGVTDADADQTHTFALTGTGSELVDSFDSDTGTLVWTPDETEDGAYRFTVTVADDHATDPQSDTHTFDLVISEQNDPPESLVASLRPPPIPENTEFTQSLSEIFRDADTGDSLTFSHDGAPDFVTITGSDMLRAAPVYDDSGVYDFTITATDTAGAAASIPATLEVSNVNRAPTLQLPENIHFIPGTSYTFDLTELFEDLDENMVEFTFTYDGEPVPVDSYTVRYPKVTFTIPIEADLSNRLVTTITDSDPEPLTDSENVEFTFETTMPTPATLAPAQLQDATDQASQSFPGRAITNVEIRPVTPQTFQYSITAYEYATELARGYNDGVTDKQATQHDGDPIQFLRGAVDIEATATGRTLITITYIEPAGIDESALAIWHFENSEWTQLPRQSIDTVANIISGITRSFSPFALGTMQDKTSTEISGESREYLKAPTFGKSRLNNNQVVECGYSVDGLCVDVLSYHEEYERQTILTNSTHDFTLKTFGQSPIRQFQIGFGVAGVGEPVNNAEAVIRVTVGQDPKSAYFVESVEITDRDNTIDFEPENASVQKVSCMGSDDDNSNSNNNNNNNNNNARRPSPYHADNIGNNNDGKPPQCVELSLNGVLFREQFHSEPFVIHVMDSYRRSSHNYMNEGLLIQGPSLNPAHTASKLGMPVGTSELVSFELTRTDKLADIWTDQFGHTWTRNSFGTWLQLTFPDVRHGQGDDETKSVQVMTRVHSDFADLIMGQQNRATLVFDAASIINPIPETFQHDYSGSDYDLTRLQKLADQIKIEQERAQKILDSIMGKPPAHTEDP